jgi:hypothetical protein
LDALDWKMLIYFIAFMNILPTFGIFYDHLVHFFSFDTFFPVLVSCTKKNLATLVVDRVTRLAYFSPMGRFFILGQFLYIIARSSPNFYATCCHGKSYFSMLTKKLLGFILGGFFHKLIWSLWPSTPLCRIGQFFVIFAKF